MGKTKKNKQQQKTEKNMAENSLVQAVQAQVPREFEVEVKPDIQTSQTLSNLPKIEEPVTELLAKELQQPSNETIKDLTNREQSPKQIKIESAHHESVQQKLQIHQNQSQIVRNEQKVEIIANQNLMTQNQPKGVQIISQVRDQHSQTLPKNQEGQGQQIYLNTKSLQISNFFNSENSHQVVVQSNLQQQAHQNALESEIAKNQVADHLPAASEHIQNQQIQNKVQVAVSNIVQETKRQLDPQEKVDEYIAPKEAVQTEPFVPIQGQQQVRNRSNNQFQIQRDHNVQIKVERELQKHATEENNQEKVQATANPLYLQVQPSQRKQPLGQKVIQVQKQTHETNNYQIRPSITTTEKIQEKLEVQVYPFKPLQVEPQNSSYLALPLTTSLNQQSQVIHLQQNSAENIQVLQQSVQNQTQIIRQRVENQNLHETVYITESIEIGKLEYSPEKRLEKSASDEKIIIKPEVIQVHEHSDNVLDINQPIEIVSSVQSKDLLTQNNQNRAPSQEKKQADNKIFILVQSEEIPAEDANKKLDTENAAEVAPTQINIIQSLSFSDLDYSVERSAEKEYPLQSFRQNIQYRLPEPENRQPKAQTSIETIREVVNIENKEIQHYQQQQQPVSLPVEILVEQKVEIAENLPQVVGAACPSQAFSVLIQNPSEVPPRIQHSVEILKQSEPKLFDQQELPKSGKQPITEDFSREQPFARKKSEVVLEAKNHKQAIQAPKNENGPSLGSKLIISAASFIVAGGINWALTKSMQKSVAIGAVAAGGALAALKLRKT